MSDIVSIGDKIILERISTNSKTEQVKAKTYVSQLLESISDEELKIAMPIEGGRIVPLEVGGRFNTFFYTDRGLFKCKSVVSDRYREGNLFILVIKVVSSFEKHQRREYYRLETIIKLKMRTITSEEKLILDKLDCTNDERDELLKALEYIWYDAVIIDISGGGIRFTTSQKIEKGDIVNFKLNIEINEGNFEYKLAAAIISVTKLQNKVGYFEYRAEFHEITKHQREHIIKFIFEEDRKKRRKEKGLR